MTLRAGETRYPSAPVSVVVVVRYGAFERIKEFLIDEYYATNQGYAQYFFEELERSVGLR